MYVHNAVSTDNVYVVLHMLLQELPELQPDVLTLQVGLQVELLVPREIGHVKVSRWDAVNLREQLPCIRAGLFLKTQEQLYKILFIYGKTYLARI